MNLNFTNTKKNNENHNNIACSYTQPIHFSNSSFPSSLSFLNPSPSIPELTLEQTQKVHLFSLVHFCEQSGPSIVFVTQTHALPSSFSTPKGSNDNQSNTDTNVNSNAATTTSTSVSSNAIDINPSSSKDSSPNDSQTFNLSSSLADSNSLIISLESNLPKANPSKKPSLHTSPKPELSSKEKTSPTNKSSLPTNTVCPTCLPTLPDLSSLPFAFKACLEAFPSFRTIFPKMTPPSPSPAKFCLASPLFKDLILLSTRHPMEQDVYPILKTACVRSLSCELTVHRSGPVYFTFQLPGFQQTYHTLTYHFQLSDATSRGNVRAFAFIYLSSFKEKVVAGWDRLIKNFSEMAAELSSLSENISVGQSLENSFESTSINELTPQRYLKRRGIGSDSPRLKPLTEMLGIDTVFITLHLHFATLVRDTLFTSDTSFDAHQTSLSSHSSSSDPFVFCASPFTESDASASSSLPWISLPTLFTPFFHPPAPAATPIFFSHDPLLWPSDGERVFHCLAKALGSPNLVQLLTHLLTGDQLILRGNQRDSLPLANALASLLPKDCGHILVANAYRHSWECNILCIDEHIPIPTATLKKDLAGYALMDIEASTIFLVDSVRSMMYSHEVPKLAWQYAYAIESAPDVLLALTMIKLKWLHLAFQFHFLHQIHMEHLFKKSKEKTTSSTPKLDKKWASSPSSHTSIANRWWNSSSFPSAASSCNISTSASSANSMNHSSASSASSTTSSSSASSFKVPSLSSSLNYSLGSHAGKEGIINTGMNDLPEDDSTYDDVDLLVLRFWARTFRNNFLNV